MRGSNGDVEPAGVLRVQGEHVVRHPPVTLMGTVVDRKLLYAKVERLLEFEVDDNPDGNVTELWVGYPRKMCDAFVESAGHPGSAETLDFWGKVDTSVGGACGFRCRLRYARYVRRLRCTYWPRFTSYVTARHQQ